MRQFTTALLLLLLVMGSAMAQSEVTGKVLTDKGEPLPYTTVKLIALPDSTTIVGGVTNGDGTFTLSTQGHTLPLLLEASLIGYAPKRVLCQGGEPLEIRLSESATMLEEVAITADRVMHKLVAGGLSITIEGTPLSQLTDIYSVLRGLPLVEVKNEEVTVTGKGTPIIYINDRKMTDKNQLRNLKPHLIKDIQVVTNPSAKYSSSVAAVIKIYTRREPGTGLSGMVEMVLDKYKGSEPGYHPRASMNYRYNNWDFFLSGNYMKWNGTNNDSEVITKGKIENYEWENLNYLLIHYYDNSYNIAAGLNYEDEQQSFGFRYSFGADDELWYSWSHLKTRRDNSPEEEYHSRSTNKAPWSYSHHPSIYYLRKLGNWKAQVDVDYYKTTPTDKRKKTDEGHTEAYELRHLESRNGEQYQSLGLRADVNGPLWGGSFSVGSEFSWVDNKFFVYNDKELTLPDLNTRFREDTYALYTEYSLPIAQKYMLSAGLRMEYVKNRYLDRSTKKQVQSNYSPRFFPTLSMGGELWGINTQLSFRSTIYRPNYWQTQPQYRYISRSEYQVGDPQLRPAINYSTQLMLNKSWATLMLGYNYAVDRLTQETEPMYVPNETQKKLIPYVTVLRNINAKPFSELFGTLVLSPKIKFWQPTFYVGVQKQFGYDLYHFEKKITHTEPTIYFRFNNQLTLPWDIYITGSVEYSRGGWQNNMHIIAPFIQGDAQITKKWLKDKSLTTSLQVNNFLKNELKVQLTTPYTELTNTNINIPRVQLYITYRFNATQNKYKGKGALGSVLNRM